MERGLKRPEQLKRKRPEEGKKEDLKKKKRQDNSNSIHSKQQMKKSEDQKQFWKAKKAEERLTYTSVPRNSTTQVFFLFAWVRAYVRAYAFVRKQTAAGH